MGFDISSDLLSHYQSRGTTLADFIRIDRRDGLTITRTSLDETVTVDGMAYEPGFTLGALISSAGLAVGNTELRTLHDGDVFTDYDILAGLWRNAAFTIFTADYTSPASGVHIKLAGTIGEAQLMDNEVVVELRDLRQYFQQSVGRVSQHTCPYRFGSPLCGVDLGPITVSGTVTHVIDRRTFRDTGRTEVDDRFGNGEIEWTGGNNEGVRQQVLEYGGSDDTFHLAETLFRDIQVGDTYTAIPGCRHRWEEDCKGKWDNLLNHGGDKDAPSTDEVSASPA